ncbi:hypothetical protein A2Z67_06255 [Candidatus Woesebacteria bacterium RBG_13_36_22]|uniref:Uncharacterized protein n=1 Tax=Candidatus Woesebacteria bacterium RBG_13_36_22 TaxID=1802478 RepID=A0A1F7X0E9_9BACT|nr:MAG: hypothetical protein A2Z67_06255 [Candidatus Woesebacteria bacterium RBG_13_36_22]
MAENEQKGRTTVIPPLPEEESGKNVQSAGNEIEKSNLSPALAGKQYVSIEDFNVDLQPVPKLWPSKNKILMVMPMTKGDRDDVLKPINGQKIEAQADGSTKGFFISIDLFDEIKKGVIQKSLKHYTAPNGKSIMTKEKLEAMDNKSYEELAEICLSVNKIDFFETNTSDVAAGSEIKNS